MYCIVVLLVCTSSKAVMHLTTPIRNVVSCSVYERAAAYVGTDYQAHSLWDKYLRFEDASGSTQYIAALYGRILACPIKELDRYYTRYYTMSARFVDVVMRSGLQLLLSELYL